MSEMSLTGVITWGKNPHGQLGHGEKQHEGAEPTPGEAALFSGQLIRSVKCGTFHTAAVVVNNGRKNQANSEVYTWGRGTLGLLGHGDEADAPMPRRVSTLSGLAVHTVSCGMYHSAAVTEGGELYSWGWKLERAGGRIIESYSMLPGRVDAIVGLKVRKVSCGHNCTAAVTTDGSLYTWGKGNRGQLGHGHTADFIEPERVRVGALYRAFVWDASFGRHFMLVLTGHARCLICLLNDLVPACFLAYTRFLPFSNEQRLGRYAVAALGTEARWADCQIRLSRLELSFKRTMVYCQTTRTQQWLKV